MPKRNAKPVAAASKQSKSACEAPSRQAARRRPQADPALGLGYDPAGFAEQVRRECEIINASAEDQRVLAEIEALTDFESWK